MSGALYAGLSLLIAGGWAAAGIGIGYARLRLRRRPGRPPR